ncbi:phasin family protein [Mesorhizobium xinjiangense]|uniref:phasin family protein n=1 Tax=Mesorhizobium xinjiangense TaxID=2678685 RepID=UPI0012EE4482|nr:phasin family protein [Mesorhizobium xinjiangense]
MPSKTTGQKAANDYFEPFRRTLEGFQDKFEVPAAAREFVQRGAVSAKEQVEKARTHAEGATAEAQTFAGTAIGRYADFSRGLVEAGFANVEQAFDTLGKIAGAASLEDAAKLQSDYLRDSAKANMERLRANGESAQTAMNETAEFFKAGFARFNAEATKAAKAA